MPERMGPGTIHIPPGFVDRTVLVEFTATTDDGRPFAVRIVMEHEWPEGDDIDA